MQYIHFFLSFVILSVNLRNCYFPITEKDPYKVLQINSGWKFSDIKQRYHEISLQCHPDKLRDLNEEQTRIVMENMAAINSAFETLAVIEENNIKNEKATSNSTQRERGSTPTARPIEVHFGIGDAILWTAAFIYLFLIYKTIRNSTGCCMCMFNCGLLNLLLVIVMFKLSGISFFVFWGLLVLHICRIIGIESVVWFLTFGCRACYRYFCEPIQKNI
jgi:hypothetical protein